MTEIKHINESLKTIRKNQEAQKGQSTGDGFREAFDKVLSDSKAPPPAASSLPALGELQPVRLDIQTETVSSPPIIEKTDGLLNLLDRYVNELTDPTKTLKELEPLIREVRDHADALALEAGNTAPENAGLKEIADRSALAAHVEYIKFMRGDYL